MRLILALAAHFKPSGVRSASQWSAVPMKNKSTNSLDNHRPLSATAMVQTAAAALAEVRQDVSRSGREIFRYKHEVQRKLNINAMSWFIDKTFIKHLSPLFDNLLQPTEKLVPLLMKSIKDD
eukprot:g37144.t1